MLAPLAVAGRESHAGPVRLLTVGKLEPRKNHLLLLEAVEPMLRSGHAVLTMVGEVSNERRRQQLEKVTAAVRDKGLEGSVTSVPLM